MHMFNRQYSSLITFEKRMFFLSVTFDDDSESEVRFFFSVAPSFWVIKIIY